MINSPDYKIAEVVNACRSISNEINVEKLLEKIMKIFLKIPGLSGDS